MNVSYKWLKEYLTCDVTAEKMAEILTDICLEVEDFEKIETIKGGLAGVVVGEVLTCTEHPDSDHLHLTTVNVGGQEPLQIVCGAPNVAAGQKVLCATIGAVLYPIGETEGFKIKKSKIRGVESFGMLCAEDELGIGTGHDGIMVLPAEAVVGTPAKEYLHIEEDYRIGIGLTPNRADAMSHYGVARDLAAYLTANNIPCTLRKPSVEEFAVESNALNIPVEVVDTEGAPRYAGITITGAKIGPSPEWMQNYLRAIGLNPHNNLVDITNFILHELGQPLHAFDADKIAGGKIVVRTCPEGTVFKTLDGVERKLSADDVMICDAEKPMCIAGVFGGEFSGVSDTTTNLFIESAYFNPVRIRKTAKRHGLNTDASFRFERGIDPNITVYALKRAAMLFKELAGGEISSEIIDIRNAEFEPFRFEISLDRTRRLIGKDIDDATIKGIIAALDVTVEAENNGVLSVAVPRYRVDVQREADLIEDILRIYGYNNIEIPEHVNSTLAYAPKPDKAALTNKAADFLADNGYSEIMSNSLTKASYYEGLTSYPAANCVRILNPLSADLNVMRQTLLFNALEAVALNANRKNGNLKLFELGNCYFYDESKRAEQSENGLAPYSESFRLAITVTGLDRQTLWNGKAEPTTYFTLKAIVERLLRKFGIDPYALRSEECTSDLFDQAMAYSLGGKKFMEMGVVSGKLAAACDVKSEVFFAEIDFDAIVRSTKKHKITAEELSKFPEVKRDLALVVDKNVSFEKLRSVAFAAERKLLKRVSLFDVYEGDKMPEGKKSYALSFILEDKTQTMNDKTIDNVMSRLIAAFEKQAGASVRA
ncbi:MAG: phenylalanine--tRNA ligase subunit beta [Rikenellaceae bacterium]|nr:phenylalanine--tRNA ligase subunit beta [Rikenellaceae bacterium]